MEIFCHVFVGTGAIVRGCSIGSSVGCERCPSGDKRDHVQGIMLANAGSVAILQSMHV